MPGSAADSLTEAQRQEVTRKALILRHRAQTNLATFFSLVMRSEKEQLPVRCMPHQRVFFDFVQRYPMCVVRQPVNSSKTFNTAGLTLWLLGNDPGVRGAIISATQAQAAKPLSMVRDYIETSSNLKLVFPTMQRSPRPADPWTQTEITVARPPGIRDPSLVAIGIDGALPGARLSWIVIDDILSRENTATPAMRQKVMDFLDSTVLPRLDPQDARIIVTNTPWHADDITYRLAKEWPTLTMDIQGGIHLANCPDFDTADIRPSRKPGAWYRLADHDPDPEEKIPLWPERFSAEWVDAQRAKFTPVRFQQLYMCQCRDEESARCKTEWVEQCKVKGLTLVSEYKENNPTVTGVDLAVGQGNEHDATALFTFECQPNGKRRILDVDIGRWDAPTIIGKIIQKATRYKSIVRVESNASQKYIVQMIRSQHASVPVRAHTTTRANKEHVQFGVEGLFTELYNGAWMIPADDYRRCPRQVQEWIDACLNYEPGKHVADVLIAAWLAREQARELGFRSGAQVNPVSQQQGIAASLMSR